MGTVVVYLTGSGSGGNDKPSSTSLDFGNVRTGTGNASTYPITISNIGNTDFNINNVTTPTGPFTVTDSGGAALACPIAVVAGTSTTINVTFTPLAEASYTSSFVIDTDALNGDSTVTLQGAGVNPNIQITPAALDFGSVTVGTSVTYALTLKNIGTGSVTIDYFSAPSSPYSIIDLPSTPYTIAAGQSLRLLVTFAPSADGTFNAVLGILYDYASQPSYISITGTAGSNGTSIQFMQSSSQITSVSFGTVLVGTPNMQTIQVYNNSTGDITINSVSVSGSEFTAAFGIQ